MSEANKSKGVVTRGKEVVQGTKKVAQETSYRTKQVWHWAGRTVMIAMATVPGAAAVAAGVNAITRVTKHVDFLPDLSTDFVPNAIEQGQETASSWVASDNVAAQAAGAVVAGETAAAHLGDMASTPGEFVGGAVGGLFDGPGHEIGEEIGGGLVEAGVAAGAGKAAWELAQRVPTVTPKPVAPRR